MIIISRMKTFMILFFLVKSLFRIAKKNKDGILGKETNLKTVRTNIGVKLFIVIY